jgi:hypothetical protein
VGGWCIQETEVCVKEVIREHLPFVRRGKV